MGGIRQQQQHPLWWHAYHHHREQQQDCHEGPVAVDKLQVVPGCNSYWATSGPCQGRRRQRRWRGLEGVEGVEEI
jgi:hypothetical protein